jgi:integrase
MRGTTRHLCRDQHDRPLSGSRDGPPKGHIAGCRGGVWSYAVRVPTKQDPHGYLRRSGFASKGAADAELNRIISLLDLASSNEQRRQQIGTAIWRATARGRPLAEDRIRREVGADRDPSLPTPTVGQWAQDWLLTRRLRPGTRAAHQRRITNYLVPWLGDIPLDALRNVHVQQMMDGIRRRSEGEPLDDDPPDERKRQSDAGPAMRRKLLDLLRTIVKAAVDENIIARNPIATYKPDEEYSPRERQAWSPKQVRGFLQAAEDDRLAVLFRVALLGLRRGELLGLRWEDLDLDRGILSVRQQLSWSGGKPAFTPPKTKKSRRTFRIDADTVAALKRQRHEQRQEQLRAGAAWEGRAWRLVFAEEDGTPLRPYTPLFALKRLARKARVPELTLHELRHTAATIMLLLGVPPKVVSVRLGHATVAMTLDLYGHVLPEQDQAAADALGRAIRLVAD